MSALTPRTAFRVVATTEAITWVALLVGMFVKYVPETTEVGVTVAGPVHGVAFIAYCLVTLLVATDQGWSKGRTALGLLSAIPPLMTLWFDRHVERRGGLDTAWHSSTRSASGAQRAVGWLLGNPGKAGASFLVAVAALTGVALLVGPPVG